MVEVVEVELVVVAHQEEVEQEELEVEVMVPIHQLIVQQQELQILEVVVEVVEDVLLVLEKPAVQESLS
jgi:hypothetical protein